MVREELGLPAPRGLSEEGTVASVLIYEELVPGSSSRRTLSAEDRDVSRDCNGEQHEVTNRQKCDRYCWNIVTPRQSVR